MDEALAREVECTLVTRGRRTGEPRPIVIWFAAVDGTVYVLSGGGEAAHWVTNLRADPSVEVRIGGHSFRGRGRVIAPDEAADAAARAAIAAKYGTTGLQGWLRTSLPVEIELEDAVADAS